MASTTLTNGLEVPTVAGAAVKSSVAYSSHPRTVAIPNFDEEGYDEWAVARIARSMMVEHEMKNGLVYHPLRKQLMLVGLEMEAERIVYAPKKKRADTKLRWFVDVPYKHNEKTGEVFEGPISSQKTYEKQDGEHQLVFVNAM